MAYHNRAMSDFGGSCCLRPGANTIKKIIYMIITVVKMNFIGADDFPRKRFWIDVQTAAIDLYPAGGARQGGGSVSEG